MNRWYKFFKWLRDYSDKQMQMNYLKPLGGCDSCCPRCNKWESQGNKITTEVFCKDTDKRVCHTCGYEWRAIFTPAGFVVVDEDN